MWNIFLNLFPLGVCFNSLQNYQSRKFEGFILYCQALLIFHYFSFLFSFIYHFFFTFIYLYLWCIDTAVIVVYIFDKKWSFKFVKERKKKTISNVWVYIHCVLMQLTCVHTRDNLYRDELFFEINRRREEKCFVHFA